MERELDRYLAGDPEVAGWPYPMYHRWRSEHPVFRYESGPAVVLTRYEDVRAVMADSVRISNDGYRHGPMAQGILTRLPEADRAVFYEVMDFESGYISRTDGDQHARLRRIASRAFTPPDPGAARVDPSPRRRTHRSHACAGRSGRQGGVGQPVADPHRH